jgi:type III secretion protein V
LELGVALPGVRARATPALEPDRYVLSMQEVPVGSGVLRPERWLALEVPAVVESYGVVGEPGVDPTTGGPATWIHPRDAATIEEEIAVLKPAAVVAYHLGHVIRRSAAQLVGIQEVQSMLDQLERAYPALVRNVVPKPVSLALLADVLRRLVDEGVSIRPLREVLETLAVHAPTERDPVTLTELVRAGLKGQITHRHSQEGVLPVYLLGVEIEEAVRDAIQRTSSGAYLALAPDLARDILAVLKRECRTELGEAIVLTQADIRRFVRRLVEAELPHVIVLSFQELAPTAQVQPLGRIAL